MNLQTLLGIYQNDIRIKQLAAAISLPQPILHVQLQNLYGASISLIASAVWQLSSNKETFINQGANHVFVLNNYEDAAYFLNDIEQLTKALDVCFFPSSFKKNGDYKTLNSSHLMLRTEALTKFTQDRKGAILVTYPEALIEKVVNPKALSSSMIHLKVSDTVSIDGIIEQLINLGFSREDFVSEPGQIAMRGGILDIYSYGNEHPYRIEFFGNEIDSIRIFNPETQLSERKLLSVSIIPNIETNFEDQPKISLLDYLPYNTCFWFKDFDFSTHRLQKILIELPQKLGDRAVAIEENDEIIKPLNQDDFENFEHWKNSIQSRHIIEWNNYKKSQILNNIETTQISFASEEQPAFNRQFDLLIADLKKYKELQYNIFIFAENTKQLERLYHIFEDLNVGIPFIPIPITISKGFVDHDKKVVCYTDHQIFQRYHKYKVKQSYSKGKSITLKALRELQPGDYVTHIDHGVGRYSGLQKIEVNGNWQEAVRIIYRDNDVLFVNINSLHKISKYTGKDGVVPKVHKLGSDVWEKLKNKTKKQVKDIASDLIKLYAKRKATPGFAFAPDTYLQTELEASFIYEDTPDQSKTTEDVKRDMEAPNPMDRLVCGDVGFGKTEIAIRAAAKAVADNKQVAILVPTTILAFQHYQTFKKRLKNFPCNTEFVNRFKTSKEKKTILQKLQEGKVDILIGTHSILGKDVHFKDLGLLIIDEEQKFGVTAKEKIREKRANVDTLTLTATPIPRTLQFSLLNARDLSIINTPPPNRQPINTENIIFDEAIIREAIYYETERGGQVYFVHNRVQSLPEMVKKLRDLCPDLEIAMAHGQMEGSLLEQTLLDFMVHKYDVLCSTNIVESGVDISNANTMIINNAHHFGLSDLHQLRGRVGRSNRKAFCYLITPPMSLLPDESRKRIQTLEQFSDLGSGFQIAMRDLDIRGAGNMLGSEQSGFIADIGFEMYQKILSEAIRELKSTDFKELFAKEIERKQEFVSDCIIDTDLEILIPDTYIENITERLSIYSQINNAKSNEKLEKYAADLKDRFGDLPTQVIDLFIAIRCRSIAINLGFEKIILKNKQLKLYFTNNPESPYFESDIFNHILQHVQTKINNAHLKQVGKNLILIINKIDKMTEVEEFLKEIRL